jgi:Chaperone of endosialidase
MKNRSITCATILLTLASFALSPIAQAVVPAPDGGYGPPAYGAGNTAQGFNALLSLGSGVYNTTVGTFSLQSTTTGKFNTALGAGALRANTADQNTATGTTALYSNTTGFGNTANGAFALFSNTTGSDNTATGTNALILNTIGNSNTADGVSALANTTTGQLNTAVGASALLSNTTGNSNTANGVSALANDTTGQLNTAIGASALLNNTIGSNNIALGVGAGSNIVTASDTICIGIAGVDVTDGCYIGHVFEEPVSSDFLFMYIDSNGKVGTQASSRRFKNDIKPMDKASEAILSLKPVTFHYKNDAKCSPRFGLIAEEVADVDPNLVALDKEGKPYTVRYDQVDAMLLNEFLKEHRKVHELQTGMAGLTAQLKQQAAQIQKVSAQVQMRKPTKKVVLNNP